MGYDTPSGRLVAPFGQRHPKLSPHQLPRPYPARRFTLSPDRLLAVRRVYHLTGSESLLLAALAAYDWADRAGGRKGVVWPSLATLAADLGVTPRTVSRGLARLVAVGLIAREQNRGGRGLSAVTRLCWPLLVAPEPLAGNSDTGDGGNQRSRSKTPLPPPPKLRRDGQPFLPWGTYQRFTDRSSREGYLDDARTRWEQLTRGLLSPAAG
ncbi:MAG: helix-turn-helix domain-containing protein [Anaerolineales bacterium]|nr:helix-turn-helix domain-containing protein [Anaerolineales bacterium]